MAELLITSSLDPIEQGDVFAKGTSLPRHVTVWQYFELPDFHLNDFIAGVGCAVEGFAPLRIEATEDAQFGPNNDVPVRRVKALGKGATLRTLHAVLGAVIEQHEGTIVNPEWAYAGYSPHITYVDGRALEEGETAELRTVELIEKNATSKDKFVRKIWKLEEA